MSFEFIWGGYNTQSNYSLIYEISFVNKTKIDSVFIFIINYLFKATY